jgi:hypothetical protein
MNVQIDAGTRTRDDFTRSTEPTMRQELDAGNRVFFFLARNGARANAGVWFEAVKRPDDSIRYIPQTEKPQLGLGASPR